MTGRGLLDEIRKSIVHANFKMFSSTRAISSNCYFVPSAPLDYFGSYFTLIVWGQITDVLKWTTRATSATLRLRTVAR